MSLEEIKNNYAVTQGYDNWELLLIDYFHDGVHMIDDLIAHENEVMKIYAMECLKLASSKLQHVSNRLLITNENNIIK